MAADLSSIILLWVPSGRVMSVGCPQRRHEDSCRFRDMLCVAKNALVCHCRLARTYIDSMVCA